MEQGTRSILENRLGVSPISDFKFRPAATLVQCERSVDGFAQELSDGAGREFAPFDADAVSVLARHVGFDRRSFMPGVRRQKEGDLNPGQHPRIEVGLDERTADTQVDQPPIPRDKPVGRYPHRKINLHAPSPAMIHAPMLSRRASRLYRTNTDIGVRTDRGWAEPRWHRPDGTISLVSDKTLPKDNSCTYPPISRNLAPKFCTI
jgi:hypothetical protein